MRRGAKPGKAKVASRLPVARKPLKNKGPSRMLKNSTKDVETW
jgi:hypothetical protein